jgi:hypothetical protein
MSQKIILNLAIVTFSAIFLGGCSLNLTFDKRPSGLKIDTLPKAEVFLNDKSVGETPYANSNIKAGDYILKLVPVATDSATANIWETKLTLSPQTTTLVNRTFSTSDMDVESSIIELKPLNNKSQTVFSVISDPDAINVTLDGKSYGYTPVSKLDLAPGDHALVVSSPGFKPQNLSVKAASGYNLLLTIKLAALSFPELTAVMPSPTQSAQPSISPSPSASTKTSSSPASSPATSAQPLVAKPYVVISDTPDTQRLGGLNVREEASSTSSPLGLAKIGDKLPYLDQNATGWYQVTFSGKSGWVSGKYSTIVK